MHSRLLVLIGGLALLALAAILYCQNGERARVNAHLLGINLMQMTEIRKCLSLAAREDPASFLEVAATNAVLQVTALPEPVLRHFPQGVELKDTFGNAFYLRLSQPTASSNGPINCRLSIWSAGQNGSNELGRGDDIQSPDAFVECPSTNPMLPSHP